MNDEELDRIVGKLKRFLGVRDRAADEVRRYLREKRLCSSDGADYVLERLYAVGLLDDERFARNRLDYRLERGYGPLYIRRELKSFRIEDEILRELLNDEEREERFREAAGEVAARKLPALIEKEDAEQRLRAHLASRGFTSPQVDAALVALAEEYPHWGLRGR